MKVKAPLVAWVLGGLALLALLAAAFHFTGEPAPTARATQDVHVTASRYAFEPGNLTVKAGTKLVFHLTSTDVTHGFAIKGTSIYVEVPPGKETVVTFTPTEAGVFDIYCTVFCGSGHPAHRGRLVVEA